MKSEREKKHRKIWREKKTLKMESIAQSSGLAPKCCVTVGIKIHRWRVRERKNIGKYGEKKT